MPQKANSGSEVIMVGIGGMGVLVAGQVLTYASMNRYKYVSWFPSYFAAMRGGLCECTVVYSNDEILSPIVDQADAAIILDSSQYKAFEPRVKPGGLIIVEASGMKDEKSRDDIKLLLVPGLEAAVKLGGVQANNLILLGVYVSKTKTISPDLIEQELDRRFGGKEAVLKGNKEAFRAGFKLADTLVEIMKGGIA